MGTLGHLGGEAQLVEHFLGKPARADCLFLRIPAWQRKSPCHGTVEADDLVELPQARKSEMVPSNGTTAIALATALAGLQARPSSAHFLWRLSVLATLATEVPKRPGARQLDRADLDRLLNHSSLAERPGSTGIRSTAR